MRLSIAMLALALLTGEAMAQSPTITLPTGGGATRSKEQIEKSQRIEDAYKSTMDKLPDQQPAKDPWGNVRAAPPQKAGAKIGPKSVAKQSKP